MNNNEIRKINLQLFADDAGANPDGGTQPDGQAIDYEQEYKKQALEMEKLKNAISKTNAENADYKRKEIEQKEKELAKMSEEEQKDLRFKDLEESNKKLQAELEDIRIEKEVLGAGFTVEDYAKLKDGKFSVSAWAELFKAKQDELTKTIKAELLKNGTTPENLDRGSTNSGKAKSDFAVFQDGLKAKDTNGKVEL